MRLRVCTSRTRFLAGSGYGRGMLTVLRARLVLFLVVLGLISAPAFAPGAAAGKPTSGLKPSIVRLGDPGTVAAQRSAGIRAAATPAAATGIGPGSKLIISRPDGDYGCTANFVWKSGTATLLGAAGHCFLPEDKVATAGPGADYNPSNVKVSVCVSGCNFGGQTGFIVTGTLVPLGSVAYARQTLNGKDIGNDFGLVRVPAAALSKVRASLPVWGGPTAASAKNSIGTVLCHYGNGVVVGESFPTMARAGLGTGATAAAWYADLAAAPGDSGSAVETCAPTTGGLRGVGAVGILTHLTVGTSITAGTTVARAIAMAKSDANIAITLVTGS